MKKPLLLLTFILLAIMKVSAQPVLNDYRLAPFGTIYRTQSVDATNISQGPSGANQVWNFSSVPVITSDSSDYLFLNASTTEYFSLFPMSTMAEPFSISDPSQGYTYTTYNSSYLEVLGNAGINGNDTDVLIYSNPQRIANFPMTMNSTMSDNFEYTYGPKLVQSGDTLYNHHIGTTGYVVDGYGQLITPIGSANDVLRIHTTTIEDDSIYLNGSLYNYSHHKADIFMWKSAGTYTGFTIQFDTTTGTSGSQTEVSASYVKGIFSGIENPEQNLSMINLFPNPAATQIFLQNLSDQNNFSQFDIYNSLGQKLIHGQLNKSQVQQIDISLLESGVYFLRLAGGDKTATKRFMKN